MTKSAFQKTVDEAKATFAARKSETEREDLEMIVPNVGAIIAKVGPGLEDAKYMVAELDNSLPLIQELSQTLNVANNILAKAYATAAARLEELATNAPAEEPAAEE